MRTVLRCCVRGLGHLLAVAASKGRGRTLSLLGVLGSVVCGLLALALLPAAGSGAEATRPASSGVSTVRELSELRNANSDTYLRSDGTRATKISPLPINYRDSSGAWQPIDTQLQQAADGSLQDAATPLPVSLPASLSSPVTIGGSGATVSMSLEGGGGAASASGSTASYGEVLPEVSATYQNESSRLKETLTLASAAAQSVYHYHLATTGGLTAKVLAGTIVFSDAQGHPRYVLPAPTVADSGAKGLPDTSDVHYELSQDGAELDVVISSAWLASPNRVFPVTVDPSAEDWGVETDCFIGSGPFENTSLCGGAFFIGNATGIKSVGRGLLRFDVGSVIPQDSVILSARASLFLSAAGGSEPDTLDFLPLSKTPTDSATWNKYDGTNAWAEAGGDVTKPTKESKTTLTVGESGSYVDFGVAPMVEGWVRSPETNDGMILKADNETPNFLEEFESDHGEHPPFLEVVYSPKVGAPSDSTFTSQQLTDRAGLSVNVANGNLRLQNHVLELPGIGFDASIDEHYDTLASADNGSLGTGAGLSTAADVQLTLTEFDGSRIYHDPSGAWWRFDRDPALDSGGNKGFWAPPGLNVALTEHSGGTATLEYVTSRVKYQFDNSNPSDLTEIEDANHNKATFSYNAEGTSTVKDTHGHTLTFKYSKTTGYLTSIKDALSRTWGFADNGSDQLESMTDPDANKFKYTYSSNKVKQITDPDGHVIEISYDGNDRVTEIRHVVNGTATTPGTKDVTTTFAYTLPASGSLACPVGTIGDTEVVSPNGSPNGEADSSSTGHKTFYCFNNADEVTKTLDQRGNESTAGYDASSGQLTKYQNPGDTAEGGTVKNTIAYNPSGAATKISDGTGTSASLDTTLSYGGGTGNGGQVQPSSIQTPLSAPKQKEKGAHQTFYGYDTSGNLTSARRDKEKEGEGQPEAKLAYNGNGQVTESTDPDGNTTKFKYSEVAGHEKGDLLKIEPPSPLKPTELTYDSLDRVRTAKDGRGITATYTYDGEDRVTKVEYSDGSSVSFKFDADGNTTERVDAKSFGEPYTGATSYEYDKLNRPTLETTPTAKSTRYGYDYDGNLASLEDAGGAVSYAYGSDDLLASLTEPENASHPFKFGYEAGDDNRESTTYPNGLLQCTDTDPGGRLTKVLVFKPTGEQNCKSEISPSATLEFYGLLYSLKFTEEGHEEAIDTPDVQTLFNFKAETTTTYSYDTLDRVLAAVVTNSGGTPLTSEYEYDKAGNVLLNHTYSPSTTYSNNHNKYNAANEICAIATTTPSACATPSEPGIAGEPTYDEDGDITSDGSLGGANKFAYTARDQLSSVTPHAESAKQVVSHGTGQTDLAAIGSEEVITNVLGVATTGSGESAKYYTRGSEGELLAKRTAKGKPSETEYFALDPFGSVAILTNSSGAQTAPTSGSYQYDPYGSPIGAASATFGYEAAQVIPGNVLHYGARYYAATDSQWTQRDPLSTLGDPSESSPYVFSDDDPVNREDTTGERPIGTGGDELGDTDPGVCIWARTHTNSYWKQKAHIHVLIAAEQACTRIEGEIGATEEVSGGQPVGEALGRFRAP
jgi:RHS repeat-associated protein